MYIFKLIRQFKAATGRSPTPNELSKLKQQAETMSAQDNIIQFPEGGIDSVPVDKQFGNKKSLKEFTEAEDIYETETEMLKRMNRQNKESVERLKKKKEKDLGDKLKDYDGDPDAMAMGGRAGFNVGGIAKLLKFLQGKVGKKNITTADKIARPESALNREMFDEANKRFNKKVNERTSNKAGQGRFTKAQVLIERLKNTLKTDKDPYVQENFPNFIKELEAKPELANNKNVFDTLGGPLPKNQRLVEYDDGTVDFYTQGGKGGKGMESVDLLAKDLGISLDEAAKIKMMEPEDQILEIQKRKTLMEREKPIVNLSKYTDQDLNKLAEEAEEINSQLSLVDQDGSSTLPYEEFQQLSKRKAEIDKIITEAQKVPDISGNFANDLATKEGDNVIDIEDYFDKDDMARGGIVSVI